MLLFIPTFFETINLSINEHYRRRSRIQIENRLIEARSPTGIEPAHLVPEISALSSELRGFCSNYSTIGNDASFSNGSAHFVNPDGGVIIVVIIVKRNYV